MNRVIISHGQTNYLPSFYTSCVQNTVVVLDAPTDEDTYLCKIHGYNTVLMPKMGNRSANRNAGLSYIMDQYPDTDIVEFLDGDRVPESYSPMHTQELLRGTADCVLYTCVKDTRKSKYIVGAALDTVVDTGTMCNPFYSCGFAMTTQAIRRVQEFNQGMLFDERFTEWGCEDQLLGLICSHLGLTVVLTTTTTIAGDVGGDAHRHDTYRVALQKYVDAIRELGLTVR